VIGTRGSNSEALTNHLAFNYFAPKKMLALPITVCEGGGNGVYAQDLTFAGLMVFDVSLDTGISEHGRLPFLDPSTVSAERQLRRILDGFQVAGQTQHLHWTTGSTVQRYPTACRRALQHEQRSSDSASREPVARRILTRFSAARVA